MYRYVFAVGEDSYCCWDHELPERNQRFLATVDAEYFHYVARRHLDQFEGEDRHRAAIALRTAYHHGLETLFSLLGALAQAPNGVPAWLPKCSTRSLRSIVRRLSIGAPPLTQRGFQKLTFNELSTAVHQFCWPHDAPPGSTGKHFGRLWTRLAVDFLDEHHNAEYNSLKHGFRAAAGGFTLRVGEEVEYGVNAPEASMQTLGGSPFGSSFFEAQPIVEENALKHHFRLRHAAVNWSVEAMAQRLQLIAWSINNVVGGLRCLNGAAPGTIGFKRPEDPDAFDDAWRWSVGVSSSNLDIAIEPEDIDAISRPELRRELEQRTTGV
ncbi:MAG: hypothetical protein ACMG51_10235 [Ginsengibacter sp.]